MKIKLYNESNNENPILDNVLINRGVPINELQHYLNTTDKDINNAETLGVESLNAAISALFTCIKEEKECLIIVDSDCDGYTSSAILINYLYKICPIWVENHLHWFIHKGKEHGLSDCIDEALKYSLVICPDSSSPDYEYHAKLKEKNISCIVLDHHEAEKISNDAIVINNQLSDYLNKDFSGAGIVWQFCRYIDKLQNTNYAEELIDLCALGLVGDMMSLLSIETKHIINKGFKEENIKNPFIYYMAKKNAFKLGDTITSTGAAFYIVPFINATVRSGTQEEKEIIFQAMLTHRAFVEIPSTKRGHKLGEVEQIVTQAVRQVTNIKKRQTNVQDSAMAYFEDLIQKNDMLKHKVLLFLVEPGAIDRNVAGLVANKLMAKYQRPCCILTKVVIEGELKNTKDDAALMMMPFVTYQGSARGCDKVGVTTFKDICENTGATLYVAGHQGAFGLGLNADNISEFIKSTDEQLKDMSDEPMYYIDKKYYNQEVSKSDILSIANHKELWGSRVEEPLILIEHLKVNKDMVNIYRKNTNTLKITLNNGISLIKFCLSEDECLLFESEGMVDINVVGYCRANEWMGNITPQIEIADYEVISQSQYCF